MRPQAHTLSLVVTIIYIPAQPVLYGAGMMMHEERATLSTWLSAVSQHLEVRRAELRTLPKPARNREREKARRQARQLFAEYERDCAIEWASQQ